MLLCFINVLALLFHNALFANAQGLCRETGISGITGTKECGKHSVSMVTGLTGGRTAVFEEMPWQAGIYSRRSEPYMQICGGSLVSKLVVISAAHCFWNELQRQLPAEDYSVAVGKLYRPWNEKMDINAQKSKIREIHIPPRYHGSTNNFQDDLALLVVATPFVMNAYVLPICLDFDYSLDKKHLTDGNMGKVAGWGRTGANGKASPTLQVLDLPSVDIQRCYDAIEPAFRPAITSDKICAGNDTGGTAVCMGDSGGGLAFTSTGDGDPRFYLRGVVSTAPKSSDDLCNVFTYATFTHVIKHEHYIREVIAASSEVNVTDSASSTYIDTDLPNSNTSDTSQPALEPLRLPNESKPTETEEQETTDIFHTGSDTQIKIGGTPLPSPKEAYDGITRLLETLGPDPDDGVEIKTGGTKNDGVIQSGGPPDSDVEAEYTVKIIEEPLMGSQAPSTEVKTGPATEKPYLSTATRPYLSTENNPVQSSVNQPESIENEPFQSAEIQLPQLPFPAQSENQPPQSNLPDQSIVNLPTQSIVNLPSQSIGNRPDLSVVNLPPQSIVNRPDQSIVNLPPQSIGNRPDQSIVNLPPQSKENRSDQSTVNLPPQSIENRSDQSTVNLPPQSIGNRPDQSIVNLPPQSIVNLPPQSFVNLPPQSFVNLPPQSIVNLPAQSIEIQPSSSIGKLRDKSIVKLPPQSIVNNNLPPQSIVNLPTRSQGIKQELSPRVQPHQSAGSEPSVHIPSVTTTQTKSDRTHLNHKCTDKQTQALNDDHYHYNQYPHQNKNPHDYQNQHERVYQHGHHHQHGHYYHRHGYHQSPHYNQHHNGDWHQLHNRW